jgi:hypothetical protein
MVEREQSMRSGRFRLGVIVPFSGGTRDMRRWKLKPPHRGKRGGVTVAVTGKEAGQPDVARVQETLYGDEMIEGDHWERFSGRGQWLMEIKNDPVEVQSSAPAPTISRREERLGIKPPVVALEDGKVVESPEPAMVQPPEAPEAPVEPPVEAAPVVAPPEPETPPAASEEPEPEPEPEPVAAEEPKALAKVDPDDHSREDLEGIAYERKVTGPDGEDPSDAPNKATLAAWINGEEPPKTTKRRRRRK